MSGVREYTDELNGLIFYHVEEPEALVRCLPEVQLVRSDVSGRIFPAV